MSEAKPILLLELDQPTCNNNTYSSVEFEAYLASDKWKKRVGGGTLLVEYAPQKKYKAPEDVECVDVFSAIFSLDKVTVEEHAGRKYLIGYARPRQRFHDAKSDNANVSIPEFDLSVRHFTPRMLVDYTEDAIVGLRSICGFNRVTPVPVGRQDLAATPHI